MLQVSKEDGKKGSRKPLHWTQEGMDAFHAIKGALAQTLELYQVQPDKPFVLRTDASRYAIGAVLEQKVGDALVPVAFYSRKLVGSQKNWSTREQETYAVVSALRKWAGWIGYQPVIVKTDHKALEAWATEHVDTPSGPAGRRGRWHETFSKFDLHVEYVPGKENLVADAMSRYAYPAAQALKDCSSHGSAADHEEVKRLVLEELQEGRLIAYIPRGPLGAQCLWITQEDEPYHAVGVVTRGGSRTDHPAPSTGDPPHETTPRQGSDTGRRHVTFAAIPTTGFGAESVDSGVPQGAGPHQGTHPRIAPWPVDRPGTQADGHRVEAEADRTGVPPLPPGSAVVPWTSMGMKSAHPNPHLSQSRTSHRDRICPPVM